MGVAVFDELAGEVVVFLAFVGGVDEVVESFALGVHSFLIFVVVFADCFDVSFVGCFVLGEFFVGEFVDFLVVLPVSLAEAAAVSCGIGGVAGYWAAFSDRTDAVESVVCG